MEWEQVVAELRLIRTEVHALREEMHRYKGFVGGVAWTLSAVGGVIGAMWAWLVGDV